MEKNKNTPARSLTKIAVEFSRIVVGMVFVFSGFVKMVDPWGFAYKIQDYLVAWGLPQLFPMALPTAVGMCMLEFLLGVFLLLGTYRKITSRLLFALMCFMTPLTLWVALENPVKDCGCFGDAFVISNWATFYKNLILISLSLMLCLRWRSITPLFTKKTQRVTALFSILFALLFSLHNVFRMQVFDFRPYKVGASIPEGMRIDPEKADVYRNLFVYEKEGERQQFSEDDYPWNDSTWTFVEMKTELVKKGENPKIEDFHLVRLARLEDSGQYAEDGEITGDILSDSSFVFLMTSYSLPQVNRRALKSFARVADFARRHHYRFYLLTSSPASDISAWVAKTGTDYPVCEADERVLKTMNRSNPGLMLLKNGVVMDKWDSFSLPADKKLQKYLSADAQPARLNNTLTLFLIMAIFLVPLAVLKRLAGKPRKNT